MFNLINLIVNKVKTYLNTHYKQILCTISALIMVATLVRNIPAIWTIYSFYYPKVSLSEKYKEELLLKLNQSTPEMYENKKPNTKQEINLEITKAALKHKLDPKLLNCILQVESNHDLTRISNTGDYGIGQVHIKSWKKFNSLQLTTNLNYSINASAEILSFYKQGFSPNETRTWPCRYNIGGIMLSKGNAGYRCELYLSKLNKCLLSLN